MVILLRVIDPFVLLVSNTRFLVEIVLGPPPIVLFKVMLEPLNVALFDKS